MSFKSLNDFIQILEQQNELIRIKEFVNPELEITEIVDRISKSEGGGKAVLFENNGTGFPVLINAFGSYKRMCLSLGVSDLDAIGAELEMLLKELMEPKSSILDKLKMLPKLNQLSSWMPKLKKGRGECQEIIIHDPNLDIFPVLKCWPHDGGRFITLPIVNTKDPVTGIRNVGMYRMQIFEKNMTGMHWHRHKTGARHYSEYKKLGKKMPVAVALGGDPVYTYSATAPLPDNIDEYMLAGFLRKKKVELVKCITQDIEVPCDADIIIEGFVDPGEELIWEGPFGDHTGFYSLADWYPRFHITCITHRKNAVYPTTIVGIPPMEDAWIGKATERIFLSPIKMTMLPEIKDIDLPVAGVAHNISVVKIEKTFPGQALKVMNALWGAGQMMFNKIMIVTDDTVDIHNYIELAQLMSKNVDVSTDIYFSKGPMDVLDHSCTNPAFGGKMFIDATQKFPEEYSVNKSLTEIVKFDKSVMDSDIENLKNKFPEIVSINIDLLQNGVSAIIISFKKNKLNQAFLMAEEILKLKYFKAKSLIFIDAEINIDDLFFVVWVTSGNIDAGRDCKIMMSSDRESCLVIDATIKTLKFDNFTRDWPNPVISDDKTILRIDEIWNKLGLGNFIGSPSLKYKQFSSGNKAVYTKRYKGD